MRPIAGGELFPGRSRNASVTDNHATTPLTGPGHGNQTTYFLTNDEPIARSTSTPQSSLRSKESNYGVQCLEDTVSSAGKANSQEAFEDNRDQAESSISTDRKQLKRKESSYSVNVRQDDTLSTRDTSPSQQSHRRLSQNTISQPLTPLCLASPAPGSSMPSSPISTSTKSFKYSDEESIVDEPVNQTVVFSGDEDGAESPELMDSAPQLIMPSIKMPSRRPFTDKGKNMGRLKVLIAGDSGVGKTSLIKSIVQVCEDIVHVDPLSPAMPTLQAFRPRKTKLPGKRPETNNTAKRVTEVYASTRPYPTWWSDFDDSKVLRRRKSMGDTVLERNLCFVDTPGYASGTSFAEYIETVFQYIESQLERTALATNTNDGDTLGLLSGTGGFQVDIIFYLISSNIKPIDIDFLRRVSPLCNIIPVIAKADLLAPDRLLSIKTTIMTELKDKTIQPFILSRTPGESRKAINQTLPFAVSSATASDAEVMDASLLMSPDYVQPLLPSELAILVEQVFEPENIAWLRHAAAKKFIYWRKSLVSLPASIRSPQSPQGMASLSVARLGDSTLCSNLDSHSTSLSSLVPISYAGGNSSYALARVADHTHREERLAQVRLAKWAGDLQRSLQHEKERYEALVKGERAVWLTERLGECVLDGTLVPVTNVQKELALARQLPAQGGQSSGLIVRSGGINPRGHGLASLNPRDPLGLLRWNERVKNKGWIAAQLLGSFGVIGALAVWFARSKGLNGDTLGTWNWNWWGGGA